MIDSKVSVRYASSILELALDKNIFDQVTKDIELIYGALKQSSELRAILSNPVVRIQLKETILQKIFQDKIDSNVWDFLRLIVEKNRVDLLYSITTKYIELKDEHLGIINVEVSSAYSLTEAQLKDIEVKLHNIINKKINIKTKLDKSIIGGFIAKAGDTVFDASVKHQLEELSKQFRESNSSLTQN